MGFPSSKDLTRIRKTLLKSEPGYPLPDNATIADKFKYSLCTEFIIYCNKNELSQVELAKTLEIDPARVSEILKRKIWLFSADRLIDLLEKIKPKLKLTVA